MPHSEVLCCFIFQELEVWTTDFVLPATVWLAGFFNPQSFLTAIMQSMARKNEWPLDKMCLSVEVTKKNREDLTAPPREGSYVHGLFIEGKSPHLLRDVSDTEKAQFNLKNSCKQSRCYLNLYGLIWICTAFAQAPSSGAFIPRLCQRHASWGQHPSSSQAVPQTRNWFLEILTAYYEPEDWVVWSYRVLVNKHITLLFDVWIRQIRKLGT